MYYKSLLDIVEKHNGIKAAELAVLAAKNHVPLLDIQDLVDSKKIIEITYETADDNFISFLIPGSAKNISVNKK